MAYCKLRSQIRIWNPAEVCGGAFLRKPVDCFHRGAASLVFDGFLNVTVCEEVSTTWVTQGDHKLPLPPDSLYSHQTQE